MKPKIRPPLRTPVDSDGPGAGSAAADQTDRGTSRRRSRVRSVGKLVLAVILLVAFAWGIRLAVADFAAQPASALVPPVKVLIVSGVLASLWLAALTLVFTYATCKGLQLTGRSRLALVGEFFLRSHLARYIPGRVAQLALLTVSVCRHGLPRSTAAVIVASHTFQFLLAGLILALPLATITVVSGHHPAILPIAGAAGIAAAAAAVWICFPTKNAVIRRVLDRIGLYEHYSLSTPVSRTWSLTLYIIVSLLQSLSVLPLVLWMTHDAGDGRWGIAAAAALSYPVARVFGQASVITPGGLGAREGAFVLLTSPFLPVEVAAIVSVWVRIVAMATEVGLYALSLVGRSMIRNVHVTRTSDV